MPVNDTLLSAAILAVAVGTLAMVWRVHATVRTRGGVDSDKLSAAITQTWREMDIDRIAHDLENHADDIQEFHGDIARMLRTPQERGEFGEQQLEVLLDDHLPPGMYGTREQVVDGKTPDAHIQSAGGLICIDSKFPLDNYEQYLDADSDHERDQYRRAFRDDVERQLQKIAADYVRPTQGTTDFAFAFIPSESVYYHLITEEYDLLREFTKRGVQVVSPLTFGHKLELIKADVHAQKLSEQAEDVLDRLEELGERFDDVEDEWNTLYRHISNAKNKADDVDRSYDRLREEFDRVDEPTIEN
ncbi:DNA recombination protein RmuC [Halobacterium zhouii]|uniref:DNA recombination protein RmuC n=1 Tax=Halobacterium zhouii TaxID=2902624 RepID=UPI001E30B69E|nr:DNA recombination protein RmuC [Halobacterium zhouii]